MENTCSGTKLIQRSMDIEFKSIFKLVILRQKNTCTERDEQRAVVNKQSLQWHKRKIPSTGIYLRIHFFGCIAINSRLMRTFILCFVLECGRFPSSMSFR